MRFLVLDDDGYLQAQLSANLSMRGIEMVGIKTVREFLVHLDGLSQFDLVVLDRMLRAPAELEVLDGQEVGDAVFRLVRENSPEIPVVFLTAKEFTQEELGRLDRHACQIVKPLLRVDELISKVDELK